MACEVWKTLSRNKHRYAWAYVRRKKVGTSSLEGNVLWHASTVSCPYAVPLQQLNGTVGIAREKPQTPPCFCWVCTPKHTQSYLVWGNQANHRVELHKNRCSQLWMYETSEFAQRYPPSQFPNPTVLQKKRSHLTRTCTKGDAKHHQQGSTTHVLTPCIQQVMY